MEDESLHIRYLILIAAVLCAVIIGYNAFYVPDASMDAVAVLADASSRASCSSWEEEAYTPQPVSGGAASRISSGTTSSLRDGSSCKILSSSEKESLTGKININTATVQRLSDLNGIGETLAKRIVEYRVRKGNFRTIEELRNVSGIGDKKYEKIKDFITI